MRNISKTDWSKIDAMTDEDIDISDIPPLPEEFFLKAKLRLPSSQATVAVSVDQELQSACHFLRSAPNNFY